MIKIRVPATSANMGPGFDSLGVALELYNYITVEERTSGLEIEIIDETSKFLPKNEKNLVYRCMNEVFRKAHFEPRGFKLTLENNIPVTRGLGSSSAVIAGGLYAGNAVAGYPFSRDELLAMAVKIEGHADNVTPAFTGGFTVSVLQKERHDYVCHKLRDDLRFAAIIPDFPLATKKARAVLPRTVTHRDAAYNAGHSALLAASLISGDYSHIRAAVGDRLHQYYRKNLIPSMDELFNICYRHGALGVYLSGAGPTLVAIVSTENKDFAPAVSRILAQKMKNRRLEVLRPDNLGVTEI